MVLIFTVANLFALTMTFCAMQKLPGIQYCAFCPLLTCDCSMSQQFVAFSSWYVLEGVYIHLIIPPPPTPPHKCSNETKYLNYCVNYLCINDNR